MSFITPEFKTQLKAELDSVFEQVVKTLGKELTRSAMAREIVHGTGFIDKLLTILRKYNKIVADCFANNGDIKAAYNSALAASLNKEIPGVILTMVQILW